MIANDILEKLATICRACQKDNTLSLDLRKCYLDIEIAALKALIIQRIPDDGEILDMAHRLATIDGRPYHPEDYVRDIFVILQNGLPKDIFEKRLSYLENNNKHINGYMACIDFLKTGILKDDYTGEVLYNENANS